MHLPASLQLLDTCSSSSSSPQPSDASSQSPREPHNTLDYQSPFLDCSGTLDMRLKIEPVDTPGEEEIKISPVASNTIKPSSPTCSQPSPIQPPVVKRGRGRPRKHPIVQPDQNASKSPLKGRSKTGCGTCRKRKKKCDEGKPSCLNCKNMNVTCKYEPCSPWRGGGKSRLTCGPKNPGKLPALFNGVENDLDRTLHEHFYGHLSTVLNPWKDERNPFLEILVPMARDHQGLMHALLCLSASNFSTCNPNKEVSERYQYHWEKAINAIRTSKCFSRDEKAPKGPIDDSTIAQMLVLCLESASFGETGGEYHLHMNMAKQCLANHQTSNTEFHTFALDLFRFHEMSNLITSLDRRPVNLMEDFQLPNFVPQEAGSTFGVLDTLFGFISKITNLRDFIRERRNCGLHPFVDYATLRDAQTVDADLRLWENPHQEGTQRHTVSLLYHLCIWIYLSRTVLASVASSSLYDAVNDGLYYIRELSNGNDPAQAILLMPLFLLGCAAFDESQRPEISAAFDRLEAYRSSRNIKHTRTVVELLWLKMDRHDEDSWDWETLMQKMNLSFLIT